MGDNKISEAVARLELALVAGMDEEYRDDLRSVLAHLQGEAVPVAWRIVYPDGHVALFKDKRLYAQEMLSITVNEVLDFECCALYEHPQPAELNEVSGNSGELGGASDDLLRRIGLYLSREANTKGSMQAGLLLAELEGKPVASHAELNEHMDALAATGKQQVGEVHPDDAAVDAFAVAMKAKMAAARAKGRGGWEDPAQCSADDLSRMLRDHVDKGDPRDVANFCMMLHQRGETIAATHPVGQEPVGYLFTDDPAVYAMPGSGFHPGKEPPANAINVVAVYAAPLAQGIDLGQFREAVAGAEEFISRHSRAWNGVGAHPNGVHRNLKQLLALIDGRDAGTGVE